MKLSAFLWLYIISVHSAFDECWENFVSRENNIIIIEKNDENKLLFSADSDSIERCYDKCCNTKECDTLLIKTDFPFKCFFFQCKNTCKYTDHESFHIFERKPKSILGKTCSDDQECYLKNSICSNFQCRCEFGFIDTGGKCENSICKKPKLEFECLDKKGCIAKYDVCNGNKECPDGSDEENCPMKKNTFGDQNVYSNDDKFLLKSFSKNQDLDKIFEKKEKVLIIKKPELVNALNPLNEGSNGISDESFSKIAIFFGVTLLFVLFLFTVLKFCKRFKNSWNNRKLRESSTVKWRKVWKKNMMHEFKKARDKQKMCEEPFLSNYNVNHQTDLNEDLDNVLI